MRFFAFSSNKSAGKKTHPVKINTITDSENLCDKRDNPVGHNPGQAWEKNLENCKEHKIEGQQKTKRGNSHE